FAGGGGDRNCRARRRHPGETGGYGPLGGGRAGTIPGHPEKSPGRRSGENPAPCRRHRLGSRATGSASIRIRLPLPAFLSESLRCRRVGGESPPRPVLRAGGVEAGSREHPVGGPFGHSHHASILRRSLGGDGEPHHRGSLFGSSLSSLRNEPRPPGG